MARVFVIQATRVPVDVTPAEIYGSIVHILTPGDRTSSNPDLSMRKLFGVLENFEPEVDFLLWSGGDPLSCMVTGMVMAELGILKFKYLRYEKPDRSKSFSKPYYVPVLVDMEATD